MAKEIQKVLRLAFKTGLHGIPEDLKTRFSVHNSVGSPHASKFKPWELV